MSSALDVLWLDDALVIINKPSGLAVHTGWSKDPVVAVQLVERAIEGPIHPLHRLDRATSGVLAFGRSVEAARFFAAELVAGRVEKSYLALVRGHTPESGLIDHPIPRRPGGPRVEARTAFQRLGTFERFSLIKARPLTGRLHQIRRHMKHLGHPLVGDVNYGRGEINRDFRERFDLVRLALHATELVFQHPTEQTRVRCLAPLPADLEVPLARMDLVSAAMGAFA